MDLSKLKPGDKLRCVDDAGLIGTLRSGQVYTYESHDASLDFIRVAEFNVCHYSYRFKLAETVQSAPPVESGGGRKDDSGKRDVTLLFDDMPNALYAVTEVLQWAITKKQPTPYKRGSWQGVDNFQQRYRAAMLRHVLDAAITAQATGTPIEDQVDAETELRQLAHQATDALFQLEMAIRKSKEKQSGK